MVRALALLIVVAGCASGKRVARECPPLPSDYQSYSGLHQQCNVDQKARVVSNQRPDLSRLEPLVNTAAGCYQAQFTMVVDTLGYPVPRSVRLVRTNSQSYANAIRDMVTNMRFDPARKDGVAVPQLYEHEAKMQYAVVRSGTAPTRRPPPC